MYHPRQWGRFSKEGAPGGALSQSLTRANQVWKSFLTNARPRVFSFRLMRLFKDNANLMDVEIHRISIHNNFSRIMLISWMYGFIVSLPPPPSIKACSGAFDKLVFEHRKNYIVRSMRDCYKSLLCIHNQRERGLFLIPTSFARHM